MIGRVWPGSERDSDGGAMIICDLCKQDPVAMAPNESLKATPWGLMLRPPPGSGLPEKHLCWTCTMRVADAWLTAVEVEQPKPKLN